MVLASEKKHHQIKLSIIEMIEACDRKINNEEAFQNRLNYNSTHIRSLSNENINRYKKIKNYLLIRYIK